MTPVWPVHTLGPQHLLRPDKLLSSTFISKVSKDIKAQREKVSLSFWLLGAVLEGGFEQISSGEGHGLSTQPLLTLYSHEEEQHNIFKVRTKVRGTLNWNNPYFSLAHKSQPTGFFHGLFWGRIVKLILIIVNTEHRSAMCHRGITSTVMTSPRHWPEQNTAHHRSLSNTWEITLYL